MNLFKSFTLTWWQAGLFKICLISLGVVIGATWPGVFGPWRVELLGVYVLLGVVIASIWWRQ